LGLDNTTQYNSPKQIGSNTNWAIPTLSSDNSAACTTTDGKLFTWGKNNYGQLGLGDTTDRSSPVQVGALTNWATPSMSYNTTGCLKTDGTLWMWGRGANGVLGIGNTTNYSSPKQVGSLTKWDKLSVGGAQTNYSFVQAILK
jgi:alpha-tubulin suppressor-like RCC1 family protein